MGLGAVGLPAHADSGLAAAPRRRALARKRRFGFVDKTRPVPEATTALAGVSIRSPSADDLTLAAARVMNGLEHAGLLHSKDTYAPQAYPAPATVVGGRRLALRYQVWDDSGRAKVESR